MIGWLLAACVPTPPVPTVVPPSPPSAVCNGVADVPLAFTTLEGFSGGEDFAFDAAGAVVSVDALGRLTRETREGDVSIVRGGLEVMSGLVVRPNGDVLVADVLAGALLRIEPDGATSIVASGMTYPNGVALYGPDHVLVTDQARGELLRFNIDDGFRKVLASELSLPNGVAVGNNGIYVTSFGGGTVSRVYLDGETWRTERFGDIDIALPSTPCEADDDPCMLGSAMGSCAAGVCAPLRDEAACAALELGDPCTTELLGESVDGRCAGEPLFCPFTPVEQLDACSGAEVFDPCASDGLNGACEVGGQGLLACRVPADPHCETIGADCIVDDGVLPYLGSCLDFGGLGACRPPDLDPIGGGLDGVAVGPCGFVYATEFRTGVLHRWPPGGQPRRSTPVLALPSEWIPNLTWGLDRGGFASDRLYVMDRGEGRLFEVTPLAVP